MVQVSVGFDGTVWLLGASGCLYCLDVDEGRRGGKDRPISTDHKFSRIAARNFSEIWGLTKPEPDDSSGTKPEPDDSSGTSEGSFIGVFSPATSQFRSVPLPTQHDTTANKDVPVREIHDLTVGRDGVVWCLAGSDNTVMYRMAIPKHYLWGDDDS